MTVPPPPSDPLGRPESPEDGIPPQQSWGASQPGAYGQPGAPGQPGGYGQPGADGQPGSFGQPSASDPSAAPAPAGASGSSVGAAPGTDLSSDLGAALKFAGTGLLRNPAPVLVAGLLYSVLMFVIVGGGMVAAMFVLFSRLEESGALDSTVTVPWTDMLVFYAVAFGIALLAVPIAMVWQSGSARAGEVILGGGRPRIGQAMIGPGRVLLTALLVMVITVIGTLLCYLPGIIAAVLLMYSIPAAARGASPVAAIKESVALARANLGTTIVAWLIIGVASSIGSAVIIGIIVVIPFIVLFEIGMYERLNGRRLPEPARA